MRAAWAICYTTKQSVGRLVDKNHTGYSYAHFYAEQGKTRTSAMLSNSGEYFSAWPRGERWQDPIKTGSKDVSASRLENTTAKHANERVVREEGSYGAAEAAQDARAGAWLTAWPAGEKWEMQPVSTSTP